MSTITASNGTTVSARTSMWTKGKPRESEVVKRDDIHVEIPQDDGTNHEGSVGHIHYGVKGPSAVLSSTYALRPDTLRAIADLLEQEADQ